MRLATADRSKLMIWPSGGSGAISLRAGAGGTTSPMTLATSLRSALVIEVSLLTSAGLASSVGSSGQLSQGSVPTKNSTRLLNPSPSGSRAASSVSGERQG